MNWIHDAASRLRKGTSCTIGLPSAPSGRLSSWRLISRAFGLLKRGSSSGVVAERSTLRRKRVLAAPSLGLSRLFQLPSAVRNCLTAVGYSWPFFWKATSSPGGEVLSRLL